MRSYLPVTALLAAALLTACGRERGQGASGDTGLALAISASAKDSLILLKDSLLAARQRQLSEQGALIGDAVTSARLVSEISTTLTKVRNLKVERDTTATESAVSTASSELVAIQAKVQAVIARLNASEARVRRMRRDSTTHADWDTTLVTQLRDFEQSIVGLRASVAQQQAEIATLTQRVDSVSRVNVTLAARGDSMASVNRAMAAREDSVFVAIGTEAELKAKGIVRREGGTLWFFGRGKTMVPGRTLEMSGFRLLSKANDRVIDFPRPDKEYAVVSRHDLAFTEAAEVKGARLREALRIADPEKFWAASRFLILVQR